MKHLRRSAAFLILFLALPAGLLVLSCRPEPPAPGRPPAAPLAPASFVDRALTEREADAYVGDEPCAPCHPSQYRDASRARHARTLSRVTAAAHGEYFRRPDRIHDPLLQVTYDVQVKDGICLMRGASGGTVRALAADYAFGSGRNAYTYMSRITGDEWIDLRISYYTGARKWDFTPMQKPGDRVFERKAGITQAGPLLVSCLNCHSTVVRAGPAGIDIERSRLGVRCERCHGPARAHLESARARAAGKSAALVHLEDLRRARRDRVLSICGACHRTPENAPEGHPKTENGLARFQGAALARSACFRKSPGLSCVTCHDPHRDADPSPARSDSVCRSCHSSARQTVCPVNPRAGCVRCHMPAQRIPTIPHALYHNHWIKPYPPAST